MPLTDFCKAPVISISPEDTVLAAAELMRDRKVGSLVVTKEDRPVGILTDRDLVTRVMALHKESKTLKIQEVMTKNPVVASEALGIWELIQMMKKHAVRRMPIVSGDGKLVGVITLDDLIELMAEELSGLGQTIAAEVPGRKTVAA